jgi:hypothetical protein
MIQSGVLQSAAFRGTVNEPRLIFNATFRSPITTTVHPRIDRLHRQTDKGLIPSAEQKANMG